MAKEGLKPTGPTTNSFIQQTIPVQQLVYTSKCVLTSFFAIAVVCFTLGVVCYTYSGAVKQYSFTYSDNSTKITCPDVSNDSCVVRFNLTSQIPGPVYLYYRLTNMYQNHRRYVPSRSDPMHRGDFGEEDPQQDPTGGDSCADFGYTPDDKRILYYPCGLVAMSIFNDSFRLRRSNDSTFINWTNVGIDWALADDSAYSPKDEAWLRKHCYSLGSLTGRASDDFDLTGFPNSLRNFTGTTSGRLTSFNIVCVCVCVLPEARGEARGLMLIPLVGKQKPTDRRVTARAGNHCWRWMCAHCLTGRREEGFTAGGGRGRPSAG